MTGVWLEVASRLCSLAFYVDFSAAFSSFALSFLFVSFFFFYYLSFLVCLLVLFLAFLFVDFYPAP